MRQSFGPPKTPSKTDTWPWKGAAAYRYPLWCGYGCFAGYCIRARTCWEKDILNVLDIGVTTLAKKVDARTVAKDTANAEFQTRHRKWHMNCCNRKVTKLDDPTMPPPSPRINPKKIWREDIICSIKEILRFVRDSIDKLVNESGYFDHSIYPILISKRRQRQRNATSL